jgi:hypothetical protein
MRVKEVCALSIGQAFQFDRKARFRQARSRRCYTLNHEGHEEHEDDLYFSTRSVVAIGSRNHEEVKSEDFDRDSPAFLHPRSFFQVVSCQL